METEEIPSSKSGITNIFHSGVTIHNLTINHGSITNSGVNHYYNTTEKQNNSEVSDEKIAQAIMAINGDKKPLNSKRKWAAVYWCLRWYCNFPNNVKDFCERVKELPLGELEYECDYDNIRRDCTSAFMEQDARFLDKVKVSKTDNAFYMQCREVVLELAKEMGKEAVLHSEAV